MGFLSVVSRKLGLSSGRPEGLVPVAEASDRRVFVIEDGSKLLRRFDSVEDPSRLKGEVLKVAREGSVEDNVREYEVWKRLEETPYAQDLNPSRLCSQDGKFLVADRVRTIDEVDGEEEAALRKLYRDIQQEVRELGINSTKLDLGSHNVGWHPSKGPVVFDYPWPEEVVEEIIVKHEKES
ncbi:MAG: hypothetical protein ABEK16_00950 [Candidatus Nanohalobium sp.]